jgi:eukaryotic-like serine/threonine-protein kinase
MPTQAEIDHEYEPLGVLGQGGFGVVELVRDRTSGCLFARKRNRHLARYIQLPDLQQMNPEAFETERRRTAREGELLESARAHRAMLTVVRACAVDDTGDGVLVTELCCGGSLKRLIRSPVAGADARYARYRPALAALFEGVAFLHAAGIVHRDLKPENVLLRRADDEADLAIADFGLAKLVDEVTRSKAAGYFFTLAYGSPEQMADAKQAGLPTDVFALGVLAAEAISGRSALETVDAQMPFLRDRAGTPDEASVLEVLRRIDMREVVEAMLEGFTANPRLRDVLVRAVHRDPAIRPSVGALVKANSGGAP